ncbi:MAG TPA: MFS transporter [Chloroflexota bacterium]|nr:MFS transporter [Chloroflexota bacterium]
MTISQTETWTDPGRTPGVTHAPARQPYSRWVSLLVLCTGFLLIVVDGTVVNVALPSIQADLGFTQAALAWVVNAYLIAYGGLLLLAGRLGDLIGRKRVFLLGVGMFTVASALCGLSFSQPVLIAARFVQGIGGAVGSAVILGMVVTMFQEPAERARAMGIFAFVASAGGAIGLLAGGLITEAVSWHWIFFVNVPIGVVTIVLGLRLIAPDAGLGLSAGADVLGAILVTAALMLGVYAIVASDVYGLGSSHTIGFGVVAVAMLIAFVVRQARVRSPLMPLRLFTSRNFSGANAVQALMVAGFFGFFFLGSLYMQRILQYGPLQVGLAFLPDTIAMAAMSIGLSARLITRFGSRVVLLVGLTSISASMFLFARSPLQSDYVVDLLLPMTLAGIGAGLAFTSLSMLAMADATESDSGLASGLLNTTTQVGASLGLAILATIASERTRDGLSRGENAISALSDGYHLTWAISTGLMLVCLAVAAIVLKEPAVSGSAAIRSAQ